MDGALHRFVILLALGVPAGLLAAVLVGRWTAAIALRPLTQLAAATRSIDISGLRQRLPVRGAGDELDDVAVAFNETLSRLEHAVGEMRQFSTALAHELRTPLAALRGEIELSMREPTSGEGARQRAADQLEEIDKLKALIERILLLARAEAGQIALRLGEVDLGALAESLVEQIEPVARAKGLTLRYERADSPVVHGDADWLKRVLLNLLDNAIKFTPEGGRIEVRLRPHADDVVIEVTDSGKGIDPDFLPYVFDRFRQADSSSTRAHGGLGIGLALVRHLVELHGGTVDARSDGVGKGSTFAITLPVAGPSLAEDDKVAPVPAATVSRASLTGLPSLRGLRVLVVDDEADAREVLAIVFAERGADVRSAGSVAEALGALEGWAPDVIVSDIGMPGEDGFDLIAKIRALPEERGGAAPAIALTAYTRPEDRARVSDSGFQLHMGKPAEPEAVVAAVAELAGRSRAAGAQ